MKPLKTINHEKFLFIDSYCDFFSYFLFAQNKIFTAYNDTVALKKDTENLVKNFTKDVKKIQSNILFAIKTSINTTPYLIYYNGKDGVSLPFWDYIKK